MSANSLNSPPPGGDASARKRIGGPNRPPSTHKFGANKQTRLSPQPIPQAASPLQNSLVQQFQAHYAVLDAHDAVPTPSAAINESRDSSVDQSDAMVDASVVDTSSSTASSSFVTSTASTESTPQKPMLGGIFASMDSPSVVTPSVVQQSLNSPPPAAASTSTSTTAVSSPCVNSPGKPKIVLVGDNSPSACFAPKRCQSSPVSDLTAAMDMAAIWGRYAADPSLAERLADIACIADDGERCAAIALLVQKQCEQFEVEVQRAAEVALANERAEKAALQQRLEALQLIEAKFAAVSHRPPDDTAHAKEQLEKQLLEKINELEVQSQEKKKYKAKYKELKAEVERLKEEVKKSWDAVAAENAQLSATQSELTVEQANRAQLEAMLEVAKQALAAEERKVRNAMGFFSEGDKGATDLWDKLKEKADKQATGNRDIERFEEKEQKLRVEVKTSEDKLKSDALRLAKLRVELDFQTQKNAGNQQLLESKRQSEYVAYMALKQENAAARSKRQSKLAADLAKEQYRSTVAQPRLTGAVAIPQLQLLAAQFPMLMAPVASYAASAAAGGGPMHLPGYSPAPIQAAAAMAVGDVEEQGDEEEEKEAEVDVGEWIDPNEPLSGDEEEYQRQPEDEEEWVPASKSARKPAKESEKSKKKKKKEVIELGVD